MVEPLLGQIPPSILVVRNERMAALRTKLPFLCSVESQLLTLNGPFSLPIIVSSAPATMSRTAIICVRRRMSSAPGTDQPKQEATQAHKMGTRTSPRLIAQALNHPGQRCVRPFELTSPGLELAVPAIRVQGSGWRRRQPFPRLTNVTRRLVARPASLSLSATGRASPKPLTCTRPLPSTPYCSVNARMTATARR